MAASSGASTLAERWGKVSMSMCGKEITFVPIEFNSKLAIETVPNLIADVGVGISAVYVELRDEGLFGSGKNDEDWLLAGQFFGDLTYRIRWFTVGANVKYQLTQNFGGENFDLSSVRVGGQIGVAF